MTKRMGLILALGLFAILGTTQAAITTCANTDLQTLINMGSGVGNGCTVDDKLFNNFFWSSLGGVTANSINATLDKNSGTQTYGWTFQSAAGSFTNNFSLMYTVSVNTAVCATCAITSTAEQMFAGTAPGAGQTHVISVAMSTGPTPIVLNNLTFAGNTNGSTFGGVPTFTKMVMATGLSASQSLLSFESDVRESSVPEPMTLSMMGLGLLGLGVMRRRQQGKK